MFVLYSLSMPRTVAPNEFSNKSLTALMGPHLADWIQC